MSRPQEMSAAAARRTVLAAQGFTDRPHIRTTARSLDRAVARTGVLQIDSVNVLQRAHYLPLFSRLGPYDTQLLHRAAERSPRRLVEYWAHVAAYMPVDLWPTMQHRMRHYRDTGHAWGGRQGRPDVADALLAEVERRGAVTARDLDSATERSREQWGWNWSETKFALEYLFLAGELAVARRNGAFERVYDLPERVLPKAVLEAPVPTAEEAARELVRRAAASSGVATEASLRDYYRMGVAPTRQAVHELVEDGTLEPVRVQGWQRPAYRHVGASTPRSVRAAALLSPFDPLVWERARTEDLFGFRYRIEIYVPAHKRVHGYYVLPFLLDEAIVARVDLKADRPTRRLLVRAAWAEPGHDLGHVAAQLAVQLRTIAAWTSLDAVEIEPRGDLAEELAAAVEGVAAVV
ncbi:winged helix-turn-helix domain-containing protein [Mumia zhuanghuii]|uniref:Winged helix-turn-helix domain-containing protein n=2 Tax=Mumia TaxID=1546255 RepID=A0ABW1QPV2_9ACTN|nr:MULTISPECIES: crosslink repair DNA glycosylase YcaQ family protein [Mumia]KAA1422462.1 winged helix-turn-helix domain-containing protein [Mumia zhuanghuii]